MTKRPQKILCVLFAMTIFFASTVQVWADTIEELRNRVQQNQAELNNITGQISGLEDEQDLIEEVIQDLDAELVNLYTEISLLEEQIAEKEDAIIVKVGEIDVAQAEFEAAAQVEAEQYEAMKLRIKYMYEQGNDSYVELLLTSGSMSDMLNKVEYIEDLYAYDRKMLAEYQYVKEQVAEMKRQLEEDKASLEEDKASLEADKSSLASQQTYLNGILDQKKAESANYAAEIAEAKKKAQTYKNQIAADNKKIQQLEEEERRKLAAKNGSSYQVKASAAKTVASAQAVVDKSSGSDLGKKIARYACQFIGNPYVMGGTSLTNGADCSGFTYRVYSDFGYKIPRTSYSQRSAGKEVSLASAQPGDLVCYDGHVGMYIGGGLIVHASTARTGIKVSNATYRTILSVRRII